jgi:hypothetical protein
MGIPVGSYYSYVTIRWILVVSIFGGVAVPVTVIVYLPIGTFAPTVIVTTLVDRSGLVAKDRVTPTGAPE